MFGVEVEFQLNISVKEFKDGIVSQEFKQFNIAKAPVRIVDDSYGLMCRGDKETARLLINRLLAGLQEAADEILVPVFIKSFCKSVGPPAIGDL